MGAWGVGIESSDFVLDVIGLFDEHLKKGASFSEATSAVMNQFRGSLDDSDDGPEFWLGLAQAQWRYGVLEHSVLSRVRTDVQTGAGLARWADAGISVLQKRKAALHRFLSKIESNNLRPKRIPKLIVRPPRFQRGDCLSVSLDDNLFGAAIVLAADHTHAEYGKNLIGILDYMEPHPPESGVFERRNWLRVPRTRLNGKQEITEHVAWYQAVRFKAEKDRFTVTGSTKIRRRDPSESRIYSPWPQLRLAITRTRGKHAT